MEPSDTEEQQQQQQQEEEEEEDHGLYIEEHLFTLKTRAKVAEETVVAALNRLKVVQYKMKLELEELSETELRSKPSLRKWLEARNLSTNCSFQEFFQVFLDEHKQEYRLDISNRTISLNKEACQLFGLTGTITMVQLLERLPIIYH